MRDMIGNGENPGIAWPENAKVAVNFVINYEEGAENNPLLGDDFSERYGLDFPLSEKPKGERNLSAESLFEYGSRAGIWRLIQLFDDAGISVTFFITGYALTLNPQLANYLKHASHDIAGHGWRWIDYAQLSAEEEKHHIQLTVDTIRHMTGITPQGWYTGRKSLHTRDILLDIGGFLYDSDSYSDDMPYFEHNHLIIPYTLLCNDFRFTTSPGFVSHIDFFYQLTHTFDYLYHESRATMMTIALHPRISGHPARCWAIAKFIRYLNRYPDIWLARRLDIASHYLSTK